jgi:hypothetical protein
MDRRLVATGLDERKGGVQRLVREYGGALDIGDFGRALDETQAADDGGGIDEFAEALELVVEQARIAAGQAVRIVFDADAAAEQVEVGQEVLQVHRRVRVDAVDPDLDLLDGRGAARLAQVRRAGEQNHVAGRLDDERLKEAVAEGVVARQPVHALLREEQHGVELFLPHPGGEALEPVGVFLAVEVKCHGCLPRPVCLYGRQALTMIAEIWRP